MHCKTSTDVILSIYKSTNPRNEIKWVNFIQLVGGFRNSKTNTRKRTNKLPLDRYQEAIKKGMSITYYKERRHFWGVVVGQIRTSSSGHKLRARPSIVRMSDPRSPFKMKN